MFSYDFSCIKILPKIKILKFNYVFKIITRTIFISISFSFRLADILYNKITANANDH